MAELSGFWTTTGTAVGDQQASYTQAQWSTAAKIMSACSGFEGVAPAYLNSLAGTVTAANTVAINTGGAMVDGKWFINNASQDVNIPSASGAGNTRIDRIVLRADWANFNVSVYRIAGTNASSPTAPAVTQTSGTTYDIKLYQALVTTAGVVTLTDERQYAGRGFLCRQGGSATIWDTGGTTAYYPSEVLIQAGRTIVSSGGTTTVTFPRAFAYTPIIFIVPEVTNSDIYGTTVDWPVDESATLFKIDASGESEGTSYYFSWLAIGPPYAG